MPEDCHIVQPQGVGSELKAFLNFNSVDFRLADLCSFDRTPSHLPWAEIHCIVADPTVPLVPQIKYCVFAALHTCLRLLCSFFVSVLLSNVSVLIKSVDWYVLLISES